MEQLNNKIENIAYLNILNYCNKLCPYCVNSFTKDQVNKKYFDKNKLYLLDNINLNSYDYIGILGGEPGLVKKQDFNVLYNYLKNNKKLSDNQIKLYTNGLFLERYFNFFPDIFYEYHILDIDKFKIYTNENDNKFSYIIVFADISDIELAKNILNSFNIKIYIFFNIHKLQYSEEFIDKSVEFIQDYKNNLADENLLYIKNRSTLNIYKFYLIWMNQCRSVIKANINLF
jgi:organic radical activating enzyme